MDLTATLLQHLQPHTSLEQLQASLAAASAASLSPRHSLSPSPVPPTVTLPTTLSVALARCTQQDTTTSIPTPPPQTTVVGGLSPRSPDVSANSSTTASVASASPLNCSEGTSSSPPKMESLERPSLSYKDLIIEAIETSPEKRLKLNEIYQVIRMLHPYYRLRPDQWGWQNSIRHNLSLHDCFVKLPLKQTNASGVVGHYWTVVPELSDKQTLRRRNRVAGASRSGRRAAGLVGASRSEDSPAGSPHSSASASPPNELNLNLPKPMATYGGVNMNSEGPTTLIPGLSQEQLNAYAQQLLTTLMYQQVSGLLLNNSNASSVSEASPPPSASMLEPLLTLSKLASAQQTAASQFSLF